MKGSRSISHILVFVSMIAFIAGAGNELFASDMASIKVFEHAQVEKGEVRLEHVARISCGDMEMAQRLKEIVIAKAPLPGKTRKIQGDYVKIRLKQHGIDPSRVRMQLPETIHVTRDHVEVGKERIKEIVLSYVQGRIPWDRSRVRIGDIRINSGVMLPKGKITYEIHAPKNEALLGNIPLSVLFMVDGRVHKKVWASVRIEVLTSVVVARRTLRRNHLITEGDIHLQTRDLAGMPNGVITGLEQVLGKKTKRKIEGNTVLRSDLIEFPPLVRRGDMVRIVAESGGLRITAFGKIMGKGRRGDRVRVVNLDSNKSIYARVQNSSTVRVDF
jgi:flagellar basal body P-ring formation protein FlgA